MKNRWSLVIHDVGNDFANIWVGTLFPNERKFERCSVVLIDQLDAEVQRVEILREHWLRPFSGLDQRFYKTISFSQLQAGTKYRVEFRRELELMDVGSIEAKPLVVGSFRTLPTSINATDKPFVVALGSCFYDESDGGKVSDAYTALTVAGSPSEQPDVKFLTGDQVYLDIGLDSLSPVECEIRNRIADDYAASWQALRGMLRSGGTWMLADDHEYWNNFPNTSGKNPYLWMITLSDKVKSIWKSAAQEGIDNVQNIRAVRTFSIGSDVSFCVADVRCQRTETEFLGQHDFAHLIDWAQTLTCPGVLAIAQPLMVYKGGSADKNLANYTQQYSHLLRALAHSGHDIVVLSGDVHFGRVGSVPLGSNGTVMHEIISSPLSNLTGIDGRIASGRAYKIKHFPVVPIAGLAQRSVNYESKWRIAGKRVRSWFSPLSYTKTKEHFFTLAFSKTPSGELQLEAQAWLPRERTRSRLPKKQFLRPIRLTLN